MDGPDAQRQSRHGGDLDAASRRFGVPEAGWLDLSTGINPQPYPVGELGADAWTRLPGPEVERDLIQAARRCYGAAEGAVIPAAGTQALIQWLPRLLAPARVAVIGFTYSEHERAWSAAGHAVSVVGELEGAGEYDVVILTHPNNPDGRVFAPKALLELRDALARKGGLLVVDEAFADTEPAISLAPAAGSPGLCVLRSFGKFFGLAGLRLGFAITDRALAERLETAMGPWSVSGPALAIGARALADRSWIAETRNRLSQERRRLDGILAAQGLGVVGGTDLFRLAAFADAGAEIHSNAQELHAALARQGILLRAFAERPHWLRFGLPGRESDWQRLDAALRGYASRHASAR